MPTDQNCPNRERCGKTGHYFDGNHIVRCECLNREINRRRLGVFFTEKPVFLTPMLKVRDTNCLIQGPLETIRRHMAGVLMKLEEENKSFEIMDAYRLVEIFLEKDQEYQTSAPTTDYDLFIMMLAFGDPPNRMLPNLILQVINRREMLRKPTWVVLGIAEAQLPTKYGIELAEKLKQFKQVAVK